MELGTPYDVNNIYFSAQELCEKAEGKYNWCFQLDEATYSLMKANRQNQEHIKMLEYMNTAAMYGQLITVCMPQLKQLKAAVIEDNWTIGVEMFITKKKNKNGTYYLRRKFKLYNHMQLVNLYQIMQYKHNAFGRSICVGDSVKDNSFIDEEEYLRRKKFAIASIAKDSVSGRNQWVKNALDLGLKQREVATIFEMTRSNVAAISSESKR
jgi:predicted XRE-type DNA-binding protein